VFAYGGDEVDLSVWDVSRTFASSTNASLPEVPPEGSKAKTLKAMFPAETWRAKSGGNDQLNLRQPVHITSIAFLREMNNNHLATGNWDGSVKLFDTRAGKKPVLSKENLCDSAVKVVEKSANEQ
jgi:ribosome biogenesis protein NSA1